MPVRPFSCSLLVVAFTMLVHGTSWASDPLLVSIKGPLVGRVGERASFEVEILNQSGRPLQGLRVVDYFDKGFRHDASASPIEQKGTIDLAPGTARRLTLDFLLVAEGRQCHRVEIFDQAYAEFGGATHCIEVQPAAAAPQRFAPPVAAAPQAPTPVAAPPLTPPPLAPPPPTTSIVPPLAAAVPAATAAVVPPRAAIAPTAPAAPAPELDLAGPVETTSGGVVDFVATVKNVGTAPLPPTALEFSWDDVLSPKEASDGFVIAGSKVGWQLPAIPPGGQEKREIRLLAKAPANTFSDSPATRSCVRATLTTSAGPVADEACILVASTTPRPRIKTPSEAGLRLSLADLDDPVRPGDATTLVCTVSNGGTSAADRLDVEVTLPEQARFDAERSSPRVRVEDGRIRLESIASLPPGGQRSYEITYRLPAGGTGRASALLRGTNLDGGLERSCQTSFLEQ